MGFTIYEMKLTLLEVIQKGCQNRDHVNKYNILGRPYQKGYLENYLNLKFTEEQREIAGRAWDELQFAGLIRPTYADPVSPNDWIEITERGIYALESRALDDLDKALKEIDPSFIEMRHGAWAALQSKQPDSIRQAAHSGRELITKVLHALAPNDQIRALPKFKPDPMSNSGITRAMRVRFILEKKQGHVSKSKLSVIEDCCKLVESLYQKLSATAHSDVSPIEKDLADLINVVEITLRHILC